MSAIRGLHYKFKKLFLFEQRNREFNEFKEFRNLNTNLPKFPNLPKFSLESKATSLIATTKSSLPLSALRLRREQNKFYLLCRAAATKRSVATKASLCQREVWRECKYKWFTTTILRVKKKSPPSGKALHKRVRIKVLLRHVALNIVVV